MDNWAITTSKARGKLGLGLTDIAHNLSLELEIPYLERMNRSISWMMHQYSLNCLLVEEDGELIAYWIDGEALHFHPGMAIHRIKQLKDGKIEMLTNIMELQPGAQILDCTMGMANDAVVLSFATGANGVVTALESSPLIYAVTSYGLQHWPTNSQPMKQAMARIHPICCDYRTYLQNLAPDCYDFLYFDPMFERPVLQAAGIAPLRHGANYAPLTQDILMLAKRIARQKVVVRHRAGTLRSLQFDSIMGGKYSSLAYGILYAK